MKNLSFILTLSAFSILTTTGCKKQISPEPSVKTIAVVSVTETGASVEGFTMADNSLSAAGFCWSTSSNPTINDQHSNDSQKSGIVTGTIGGLQLGSTYHVRAYATNATGTAYGEDVSFTTNSSWEKISSQHVLLYLLAANGPTLMGVPYMWDLGPGFMVSYDNGVTWQEKPIAIGALSPSSLCCYQGMFIFTSAGFVSRTSDNGSSWQSAHYATRGEYMAYGNFYPQGSNLLVGSGNGGIYLSSDSGYTWIRKMQNTRGSQSAFGATNTGIIMSAGGGCYISNDNGMSWTQIHNELDNKEVYRFGRVGSTLIAAISNNGFMTSSDNGKSWKQAGTMNNVRVTEMLTYGNMIYAMTTTGMYVSADKGEHWSTANKGLDSLSFFSGVITGNCIVANVNSGGVFKYKLGNP